MRVAATVPAHSVTLAGYNSGLQPGTPRALIIRYALARLAGRDHPDAIREARSYERKTTTSNGGLETVEANVPDEYIQELTGRFPGKTVAEILRYALAEAAGYSEDEASAIAYRPRGIHTRETATPEDAKRRAREWAISRGMIPAGQPGRIPRDVIDAYQRYERIREWAISEHGMPPDYRGELPQEVIDAYERHQETPAQQAV